MWIFDEFWACGMRKVCPKSSKMTALGCQRQNPASVLGGSASRAAVLGRVFRAVLLVLGQGLAELFDTTSTTV